jgi:hypothetical protein
MTEKALRERLKDKEEIFTRDEIYAIFEELSEDYGFHRDPSLPKRSSAVETASLTVPGYDHLPMLVVRPRTNRDSMITIPSLADGILGENMKPSNFTLSNAYAVASAQTLIVSPVGLVDQILNSDRTEDIKFFGDFAREYDKWMASRMEAATQKKSGQTSGNEPVSTSVPTTDLPPQAPNG